MTSNQLNKMISKEFNLNKSDKVSKIGQKVNGNIAYGNETWDSFENGDFYSEKMSGNTFAVHLQSDKAKKLSLEIAEFLEKSGGSLSPRTMEELDNWVQGNNKMPFYNYSIVVNF